MIGVGPVFIDGQTQVKPKATRRRVPTRQLAVADELRRRIVRGIWRPGSQLPVRADLEQTLSVSPNTLQRAMDRLRQAGFIQTDSTTGTFVSRRPPHLYRFGLVYPNRPSSSGTWSRMWKQLEFFRTGIADEYNIDIRPYFARETDSGADTRDSLIYDIEHDGLAGLVFAHPPDEYANTPILTTPSIKRVAITSQLRSDLLTVGYDASLGIDLCCQHTKKLGHTRLAIVHTSKLFSVHSNFPTHWRDQVKAHGLDCPRRWMIPVDLAEPDGATGLIELLFSGPRDAWPQVLFVQDDNLIDAVLAGLDRAGVTVPGDLKLICTANLPRPASMTRPGLLLVLDTRELLRQCIELIHRDKPPRHRRYLVKPRLETVA